MGTLRHTAPGCRDVPGQKIKPNNRHFGLETCFGGRRPASGQQVLRDREYSSSDLETKVITELHRSRDEEEKMNR